MNSWSQLRISHLSFFTGKIPFQFLSHSKSINKIMVFLFCLACLGFVGCSAPIIYKMDIRQGNALSEEMIQSLRVGLTKEQVIERLGTPTLQHTFDSNRWDYYYYFKSGKTGKETERHFTVFFKNDRVIRWQ